MPGHLGAVGLKKSHDIVILSSCNIVKGQANCGISCSSLIIRKNFSIDNVMNLIGNFLDCGIWHKKRHENGTKSVGNSAN